MRTYRDVFSLPEFRVLFAARCVTMAAISVEGLALATTTFAATGSTVLTALAMFGGPLITLLGSATILGAADAMGARRAALVMPAAYTVACLLQAIPGLHWGGAVRDPRDPLPRRVGDQRVHDAAAARDRR